MWHNLTVFRCSLQWLESGKARTVTFKASTLGYTKLQCHNCASWFSNWHKWGRSPESASHIMSVHDYILGIECTWGQLLVLKQYSVAAALACSSEHRLLITQHSCRDKYNIILLKFLWLSMKIYTLQILWLYNCLLRVPKSPFKHNILNHYNVLID